MAKGTKIGVLTGGGDVPGLNSAIKAVVHRGAEMGRPIVGIRRGWKGLTHFRATSEPDDAFAEELTLANTETIERTGGTVLHTSRTNPKKMSESKVPANFPKDRLKQLPFDGKNYDFTSIVIENLEKLGIGYLIPIGGDDTLSFASLLHAAGFPVIAVPKTMDNDVHGTEYCIGFSTAVTRAKEAIARQRTILGSHERIGIFRIFGRDAGFTALYTAYVSSIRCLIPEYPFNLDRAIALLMEDKRNSASYYSAVVVSEGAMWEAGTVAEHGEADAFGHRKKVDVGQALAREVEKQTGEETMASDLTYELRSGAPDAVDQIVATTYGNIAMDLIAEGLTGRLVGIQAGKYTHTELPKKSQGARRVDVARLYNTERYRPNYTSKLGESLLFS